MPEGQPNIFDLLQRNVALNVSIVQKTKFIVTCQAIIIFLKWHRLFLHTIRINQSHPKLCSVKIPTGPWHRNMKLKSTAKVWRNIFVINFQDWILTLYLILTSLTPVFHTGSLRFDPMEGFIPWGIVPFFYQQASPILVWLSTPDVLLGAFLLRAWGGPPWGPGWNPRPFWQWRHSFGCPLQKSFKSVQPFSRFKASKPFWPLINYI